MPTDFQILVLMVRDEAKKFIESRDRLLKGTSKVSVAFDECIRSPLPQLALELMDKLEDRKIVSPIITKLTGVVKDA